MKALKKMIGNKRTLIFIDFEGTQFSHEIIAVGAVKCTIDDSYNIIEEDEIGFKRYVTAQSKIGKVVTNMTKITEEELKEKGITVEQMFEELKQYIGINLSRCLFFTFGSNDIRMLISSISHSQPENEEIGKTMINNSRDLMTFISQYVRDDNLNTLSLVNFLKIYDISLTGEIHDPLNDAKDLCHLYQAFLTEKDILLQQYLKLLSLQRIFPEPIKNTIARLIDGQTVSSEEFIKSIVNYLE